MKRLAIIAVPAAAAIALMIFRPAATTKTEPMPGEEALAVRIVTVQIQSMPVSFEAAAQVVAEHVVQMRPQVSGTLKRVFITEGQWVSAGQRLFLIEPASFEAALISANAAWENADGKLQRAKSLALKGYVSSQDLVAARANADQAKAAYQQAKINLDYADIRSSMAGRSGILGSKAGNVVAPSDAVPLVSIIQTRPIQVQFSIPQQLLPTVRDHQAAHTIKIAVASEDGARILDQGTLVFVDNAVNLRTGTVLLKARTPNAREQLWPGQYVTVHVQLDVEPRAIVVPQTAIQTGQQGDFVYLMVAGKAQMRSVKVDREAGALAVIAAGLNGGEEVVERVPRGLRAGLRLTPDSAGPSPPAPISGPNNP